jgi:hypothetical protein
MLGRMVFMAEGGFDIDNWPHLAAWAGRLKAMPGFALPYEADPEQRSRVRSGLISSAPVSPDAPTRG